MLVVKCFQSERISNQSLQSPRPPHQNYNFISVSGRFSRIFCLFFMTRIQLPRKNSTLAEVSGSGSRQTRHSFYPIRQLPATMSLPNKKHRISVRVVQPRPLDTISLSRTHPTPSETTTHPDRPMKRFKKKALNQPLKNLNNTTPSPSFHRPNKKPRKQHAPPNFQAKD